MNSTHKWLLITLLLTVLALCGACFGLGRYTAKSERTLSEHERTDTLTIRDTVTHYEPQYVYKHTRDTIRVPVPVPGPEPERDTIYVNLPRETKVYEDARYRAEVSGYQPSLDRIDIYQQTQIITKDVTQIIKKKTRWGVGLQVGYGATYYDGRLRGSPYVGVGVSWNIIAW